MKRLFNHTKRSTDEWDAYDENDYDWDNPGEYSEADDEMDEAAEIVEEDSEIVYSDEDGVYYQEEAEVEEYYTEEAAAAEEYYPEESVEDEAFYAEEGECSEDENGEYYVADASEEYYEETQEGEVYYAEEGEYYEDENGEYYVADVNEEYYEEMQAEEAYYAEESEYYEDGNGEYYEEEEPATPVPVRTVRTETAAGQSSRTKRTGRQQTGILLLWSKFMEMNIMDRIITGTGVAVLILALITGGLYIVSKNGSGEAADFASVGVQLENINLIGERGLMAVADAELARQAAAEIVEEEQQQEQEGYDEEEYSNAVTVRLNMTSVKKDLKIKFTNGKTGKLIGNVPFSVTITGPDGKSETWTDDDMDGIIYHKDIAAGTYKVLVNELTGEKYADYTIPTDSQSVEVKKDIDYEKVDVSDEVKTESEIDVSKEDTKVNETEVESTLQDTVTWVESTAVAETYTEVSKSTIPDPTTLAVSKSFLRTAANSAVSDGDSGENVAFTATISPTEGKLAIGDTLQAKVTASGYTQGQTLVYSVVSNNTAVATAAIDRSGNITVTGQAAGTATITATINYAEGTSMPVTASFRVNVLDKPILTLDQTTMTVYLSEPKVLNANVVNAVTETAVVAESADTGVATAAVNDKAVTITGVAVGETVITVKYIEGDQETIATCTVKVMVHPKDNQTDKLKDASGNQLYVQENESYREAVYADYYVADKFFIKGDVRYTGWQTIDGNVYYFTAAGEKVTGEQIIQGAKYNFASDGSLITGSGTLGIDVSKWNGVIDWDAVKNSGVSYVIIRCGYRGSSQGMLVEDPKFKTNIEGAIRAGLKVGVYFFTQATDEIEAVEEASFVLDQIKNYRISYPVFLDVESSGGRGDRIDKTTRTAVIKAFCETIQRSGYTAGVYANKTWLNQKMNVSELSSYKIWLAQYAATPTYTGRYDMWQYTSNGRISGIRGDVDLNLSYLGY
uniref:GH25 family lysozyme n=1 Tax=Acetatifactor sp. TaxID=1872090 RepID=UPI00405787F3